MAAFRCLNSLFRFSDNFELLVVFGGLGVLLEQSPGCAARLFQLIDGDADEDEVSFTITWTIDGEVTTYTGETLPASATLSGNEISCTATPTDGEDEGDPVSSDTLSIGSS